VVFFNYTTMQVTAKIVYYGAGLCGKTTNLQYIHRKTAPKSRGEMVSLETQTDRTLFFDLLPLDVGVIGGLRVNLQLYTVPGQVFYNTTRKLVLKNVDGIVFVADSQEPMVEANIESLRNLRENLDELGLPLDEVPMVLQYNKRDLRNISSVDSLDAQLNPGGLPHFEAAALHGVGVFETLKGISRLTIQHIRKAALSEAPASASRAPEPAAKPAASAPPVERPAPAATTDALASLVSAPAAVEFAEEDTDKVGLRAVKTRDDGDIHRELESLRAAPPGPDVAPTALRDAERRVQEIRESQRSIRRSSRIQVPAQLLGSAQAVRVQLSLAGPTGEHTLPNVVTVTLGKAGKLRHLMLHLDLDLDGEP
jgi:GTPase SAR1 family protein